MMKYYDYKKKKYIEVKESKGLNFLYNSTTGRIVLKILISKPIRFIYNSFMSSKLSCYKIKKFIKKNNINMARYEEKKYTSFNDFFTRKIKELSLEDGMVAVADSKLSVYKIDEEAKFEIKNSIYTIDELLGVDGSRFKDGYALVFRLCVDDYHRYIYFDDGKVVGYKKIGGKLHTVQPIALKKYKVFSENTREITYLQTENFGYVAYVEVGAMMIGKIVNEPILTYQKGDEKGHFEFGGSTIILLFEKDALEINDLFIKNTNKGVETIVKIGESLR